jgi:hypothetical protein
MSVPECRYFRLGSCRYGNMCIFSHDAVVSSNTTCRKCNKVYTSLSKDEEKRKLCLTCVNKYCSICQNVERVKYSSTCKWCYRDACVFCKCVKKKENSMYCETCALFCLICNPDTPSIFSGPLCEKCQHWCKRCARQGNGKVERYPCENYCAPCLKELCCGFWKKDRDYEHVQCLDCRRPKMCSIPCCVNEIRRDGSTHCVRCSEIAHDMFYGNGERPFNTKLTADNLSTKYRVIVRYEEIVEEHDGDCSDHYGDFEYHQVMNVALPLPSILDPVAQKIMENYIPSHVRDPFSTVNTIYGQESAMRSSFTSSSFSEWLIGEPSEGSTRKYGNIPRQAQHIDLDTNAPVLPPEYHYFYKAERACTYGSGHCGRRARYNPLHVELHYVQ